MTEAEPPRAHCPNRICDGHETGPSVCGNHMNSSKVTSEGVYNHNSHSPAHSYQRMKDQIHSTLDLSLELPIQVKRFLLFLGQAPEIQKFIQLPLSRFKLQLQFIEGTPGFP